MTDLASFVHRRGDIDDRDDDTTTAKEGIEAQKAYQLEVKKENGSYESEVGVEREFESESITLVISGRIDGLLHERELTGVRRIVEEIKTTRTRVSDIPLSTKSVHEAQLKLYASMISHIEKIDTVATRLTYLHPDSGNQTIEEHDWEGKELEEFFKETVDAYCSWLEVVLTRIESRNTQAKTQEFPYSSFNTNQQYLARHGFMSLRNKSNMLMEAPTGTGKTIGTLFPAVKAMGEGELDRIVFSTARTTGQRAASDAVDKLTEQNDALVQVTISAKDRVCLTPGAACRPDECEYAKGHFDRVQDATKNVLRKGNVDRNTIDAMAKSRKVCPFELSLDAAEWADVVVCDYNYVFDPMVRFSRLQGTVFSRVGLLVDEAHRLTERVREMLSVTFDLDELNRVVQITQTQPIGKFLETIYDGMSQTMSSALPRRGETVVDNIDPSVPGTVSKLVSANLLRLNFPLSKEDKDAVQSCLMELFRFWLLWENVAKEPHKFLWHLSRDKAGAVLALKCLMPDTWIANTMARYNGSIRFSGTLSPGELFNEEHGLDGPILQGKLQPDPRRLSVFVVPDISTYYKDRVDTAPQLAKMIEQIRELSSANWLVAFPSFEYMHLVFEHMKRTEGVLVQEPDMSLTQRDAYLAELKSNNLNIGFIVMGGVFAESIDIDPAALEGVVVVGPGIAPRSLVQDRLVELSEQGYEIAYRRPAMTRVIQAAGRVVRGESDRGIVVLVDPRFTHSEHSTYFPNHWQPQVSRAEELQRHIVEFQQYA